MGETYRLIDKLRRGPLSCVERHKVADALAMLRAQLGQHTYIMCKTKGCSGGVRASKSRTGLCIKCLDDYLADPGTAYREGE